MKKMFALLLGFAMVGPAFGAMDLPVDQSGNPIGFDKLAGADSCVIDASTGTSAVLCATGKGVVLAVIGSSVAVTDQLVFRDSATANTTSAKLMVLSQGTAVAKIDGPFARFSNGLSVNATVAPVAATGNWTILYRKR